MLARAAQIDFSFCHWKQVTGDSQCHKGEHCQQYSKRQPSQIDETTRNHGKVDAKDRNLEKGVGDNRYVVGQRREQTGRAELLKTTQRRRENLTAQLVTHFKQRVLTKSKQKIFREEPHQRQQYAETTKDPNQPGKGRFLRITQSGVDHRKKRRIASATNYPCRDGKNCRAL